MSRIGLLLLIVVLFAGCSAGDPDPQTSDSVASGAPAGSGSAQPAPQGYDCESLISAREIDAIINAAGTRQTTSTRGDRNEILPGHTQCGYALPQDYSLAVDIYTGGGDGEGLETFDVLWTMAQNSRPEAVSGVGDEAILFMNAGNPILLARGRGRGVRVVPGGGQGLGALDQRELATRVAGTVVGRL